MSSDAPSYERVQRKAYTKWLNLKLKQSERDPKPKLVDVIEPDLKTGVTLNMLAEVLTDKREKFIEKPRSVFQYMQNTATALSTFRNDGVILHNIDNTSICQENTTLCLGLVFQLMLHYSISVFGKGAQNIAELRRSGLDFVNFQLSTLDDDIHADIREITQSPHTGRITCPGFDKKSWDDSCVVMGLAVSLQPTPEAKRKAFEDIKAAHSNQPSNPPPGGAPGEMCYEQVNTAHAAMSYAQKEYEIPMLLDAEDIINFPDPNVVLVYVSYYKNYAQKNSGEDEDKKEEHVEVEAEVMQEVVVIPPTPKEVEVDVEFDELAYLIAENRDKAKLQASSHEDGDYEEALKELNLKKQQLDDILAQYEQTLKDLEAERQEKIKSGEISADDANDAIKLPPPHGELYDRVVAHKKRLEVDILAIEKDREESNAHRAKVGDLEDKNKACGEKHVEKDILIAGLQKDNDDFRARIKALEEQNAQVEEQLATKTAEKEALQQQYDEKLKQCDLEHAQRIKDLEQQLAALQEQLAEKDEQIAALKQEKQDDDEEKAKLKQENEALQQQNKDLFDELEKLKALLAAAEAALLATQAELAQTKEDLSQVQNEKDALVKELNEKNAEIQRLEDLVKALQAEVDALKQQNAQQQQDLEDMRKKLGEKDDEISNLQSTLASTGDALDGRLQQLQNELSQKKKENQDLERDGEQKDQNLSKKEQENQELITQLAALRDQMNQAQQGDKAALDAAELAKQQLAAQLEKTKQDDAAAKKKLEEANKKAAEDAKKAQEDDAAAKKKLEEANKRAADAEKALAAIKATQCVVNGVCQCKCCEHKDKGGGKGNDDLKDKLTELQSRYDALKAEYKEQLEMQKNEVEELKEMVRQAQLANKDDEMDPEQRKKLQEEAKFLLDTMQPQAGIVFAKESPPDGGLHVIKCHIGKSAYNANILPLENIKSVDGEDMSKEAFAEKWKRDAKCGNTLFIQVSGENPVDGKTYTRSVKMELGSKCASAADIRAIRRMGDGMCKPGDAEILARVKQQQEDFEKGQFQDQNKPTDARDNGQKGYLDENDMIKANGVYKRNAAQPGASRQMQAAFKSPTKPTPAATNKPLARAAPPATPTTTRQPRPTATTTPFSPQRATTATPSRPPVVNKQHAPADSKLLPQKKAALDSHNAMYADLGTPAKKPAPAPATPSRMSTTTTRPPPTTPQATGSTPRRATAGSATTPSGAAKPTTATPAKPTTATPMKSPAAAAKTTAPATPKPTTASALSPKPTPRGTGQPPRP